MANEVEIERKWLVGNPEAVWDSVYQSGFDHIRQAYMGPTTRVRIQGPKDNPRSVICIKLSRSSLTRDEFNFPIPLEDAEIILAAHHGLSKYRYQLAGEFTLDVFQGRLEGLLLIEKEYASEEEAMADIPPIAWEATDVSNDNRFLNSELVKMTFDPKIGLYVHDPVGLQYGGDPFPPYLIADGMLDALLVTGDEDDHSIDKPLIIP